MHQMSKRPGLGPYRITFFDRVPRVDYCKSKPPFILLLHTFIRAECERFVRQAGISSAICRIRVFAPFLEPQTSEFGREEKSLDSI